MSIEAMRIYWIFLLGGCLGITAVTTSIIIFRDIDLKELIIGNLLFALLVFIIGFYFKLI